MSFEQLSPSLFSLLNIIIQKISIIIYSIKYSIPHQICHPLPSLWHEIFPLNQKAPLLHGYSWFCQVRCVSLDSLCVLKVCVILSCQVAVDELAQAALD